MGPVPTGDGDGERCRDQDDIVLGDISVLASSAESSNSETETDDFPEASGYQLLPFTDTQQDSDENEDAYEDAEIIPIPNVLTANNQWQNSNYSVEDAKQLTQDRVEEIRSIMAGVTLPTSSIPTWANIVPENEWREKLLSLARQTVINEREVCNTDVPLITTSAEVNGTPGPID